MGRAGVCQELTAGVTKPPDQRHHVEETWEKGQKCRWGCTLRQLTKASPRALRITGRLFQDKDSCGLSVPPSLPLLKSEWTALNYIWKAELSWHQGSGTTIVSSGYRAAAGEEKVQNRGLELGCSFFTIIPPVSNQTNAAFLWLLRLKQAGPAIGPALARHHAMHSGSLLIVVSGVLLHPQH